MGYSIAVDKNSRKKKRDDLTSKRNLLFKKYLNNPHDFSLGQEIKKIDDEIAEHTAKMREDTVSERKAQLLPPDPSKN